MPEELEENAEEGTEEKTVEEFEDVTFTPGWTLMMFLGLINEIIDWISIPFDLTGIWVIINYAIDFIFLFIFLTWRIVEEGFSLSGIFGNWKQVICLILEHIPVVEDFFPGWILTMWGFRKKKIKGKVKIKK